MFQEDCFVKKKEIRELIVDAFQNSEYKWRTPRGIAKDTNLPLPQVIKFLRQSSLVRKARKSNKYGEPLYTLEERYQREKPFLEKIVSKITNQE